MMKNRGGPSPRARSPRQSHLEKDADYLLVLPEFVEVSELQVNDWDIEEHATTEPGARSEACRSEQDRSSLRRTRYEAGMSS